MQRALIASCTEELPPALVDLCTPLALGHKNELQEASRGWSLSESYSNDRLNMHHVQLNIKASESWNSPVQAILISAQDPVVPTAIVCWGQPSVVICNSIIPPPVARQPVGSRVVPIEDS